ncbi:pyridoxamine 5'-phosphate oxidase family protein [Paraburkholderia sp. BCC1886]|uniref:pyridoxamine 5'-phosphate oxidase family protein n=1 Tax=Paraburkholderia sp. BCC1886 TaxID=2562670 RepID=UPI0011835A8D|nr:pyridoxamine 5'-phosphate oxidase family protein [Paraburkholderia sp. BCC1886]
MLDDSVLSAIQKSVLCWLATVDSDGCPNVSPKEIFCVHDRATLLIANIASPGSARNVATHHAVCASFLDVFVQKGVKLKGRARLLDKTHDRFDVFAKPLADLAGPRFPFASLFAIDVTAVEPIVAPSYRLYPDTVEARQIESAMRAYGVRPAES